MDVGITEVESRARQRGFKVRAEFDQIRRTTCSPSLLVVAAGAAMFYVLFPAYLHVHLAHDWVGGLLTVLSPSVCLQYHAR